MERRYRAVLFDVDGTLVDSNDVHARAWVEAFEEAHLDVAFQRVRPLIGMGGEKLVPAVTGMDADDPRVERLGKRRTALLLERHLGDIRALRGARELLQHLKNVGYLLAIATSAKDEELHAILRAGGIDDLFDTKTSSSDADSSKPDPDIVEAAVRRVGVPASQCVMIGDTEFDVAAARQAGVDFIGLRSGGSSDDKLAGAIAIHDDPAALLAHMDESEALQHSPAPKDASVGVQGD
ncbi:MAG TPA: HAD family hydrolase [Kofleriaceae bacterium]|nr:HAD family hydrolase [Kofleriaceae bacterium]